MLAPMFYLSYLFSELRRRKGRTLLTALGLGVGVGLVVTVSALSTGLDQAQEKVLEPLTGVGTDMSVTRPLKIDGQGEGPAGLSERERDQLQQENGRTRFDLDSQAEPGEKFTRTDFMSAAQLSFPASQVAKLAALDGVEDAAGSLTLSAVSISGHGAGGRLRPPAAAHAAAVVGAADAARAVRRQVAQRHRHRRDQARAGRHRRRPDHQRTHAALRQRPRGGAERLLRAPQRHHGRGDDQAQGQGVHRRRPRALAARRPVLRRLREARPAAGDLRSQGPRQLGPGAGEVDRGVAAVEKRINATLSGASVTTASDLADRVGGSLADAKSLSGKLGTALTIVGLAAAFLIASLLTLSSVTKRIRELGTLKAIGWPGRHVVRQVTGESVMQGALGGVFGALIGIGGAALVTALAPALEATVAAPAAAAGGPAIRGPGGGAFGLGQAAITSGTETISLEAPVDLGLIALAVGLALLGGLIAGSVGGLRVSRLRPADALRHID